MSTEDKISNKANNKKGRDLVKKPNSTNTARDRGGAGELSAGDLVLDMLAGHDRHELSVAALSRAAGVCGISDQSVRVALTRLAQQNKITNTARGVYALNSHGSSLFRDVENWLRKEEQAVAWSGGWIGVADGAVSRRHKVVWRRHERAMQLRGFRPLGAGVHLRPDNLLGGVAGVRKDLRDLGLAPQALIFGVTDLDAVDQRRARQLWDRKALQREYRRMLTRLKRSDARLSRLPLHKAARESLLLGRVAIRCIIHDPLLPDALMDAALRHRLIESMRQYQIAAKALWMQVLESPAAF